jgi:hypothetical protein
MSIHKIGSDLVRPLPSKGVRGTGSKEKSDGADAPKAERSDRIEISAEGRELAAQLVEGGQHAERTDYSEIIDRIQSGFYNDPSVAEEVANRLVASGDLGSSE